MKYSKKVGFHNFVDVGLVPSKQEENRSINLRQFKSIMKNIDDASLELAELINKFSKHRILLIDFEDVPIKIKDERLEWFNDISVIMLLNAIKRSMNIIVRFIQEFNDQVERKIDFDKSGKVSYQSNVFRMVVDVPCVARGPFIK